MWKFMGLLICLPILSCASLSKDECLAADWRMIGFEDGSAGKSLQTVGAHRKACAKVSVTPNMAEYEAGHLKGVQSYCTVENGFSLGVHGGAYNGVCAKANESAFLTGWEVGRERKAAKAAVEAVQRQVASLEQRLVDIDDDIKLHEDAIVSRDSTADDRREHLRITKELRSERDDVEQSLSWQLRDLNDAQDAFAELLQRQRALGYQ